MSNARIKSIRNSLLSWQYFIIHIHIAKFTKNDIKSLIIKINLYHFIAHYKLLERLDVWTFIIQQLKIARYRDDNLLALLS
jgi:hypothetical protein